MPQRRVLPVNGELSLEQARAHYAEFGAAHPRLSLCSQARNNEQ